MNKKKSPKKCILKKFQIAWKSVAGDLIKWWLSKISEIRITKKNFVKKIISQSLQILPNFPWSIIWNFRSPIKFIDVWVVTGQNLSMNTIKRHCVTQSNTITARIMSGLPAINHIKIKLQKHFAEN